MKGFTHDQTPLPLPAVTSRSAIPAPAPRAIPAPIRWWRELAELIKFRLTLLVLLTTLVGYCIGSAHPIDGLGALHAVLGTALVAAAAAILNEVIERRQDAQMIRTQNRPIAAGRVDGSHAAAAAVACALAGVSYLALFANVLAGLVAAATLATYVCLYTPLKLISPWNTWVGAVSGALPPVIGYAGARNVLDGTALFLFAILFLWQMPHFFAIAWLYRNDYEKAGFRMLVVVDATGRKLTSQTVFFTALLFLASLWPMVAGTAALPYTIGAAILGLLFLWSAVRFHNKPNRTTARGLFFSSIAYLPLLLGLLVLFWR
ncbi:heme o synthase [Methylacidimicrobium tartarophylax]|uniref:Protoheme IX farnesyltransferase n=1 Tax=Methylacidimicrobium tartarophylax TaxID=1041768 RepID=A0A5E6MBT9_9BACT|nr:heme o synthase [Methylacidimicrobium tartarophylax]VVM05795.1 heme o synthase [Methylacidimicrobium tartarophylax]